MMSVREVSGDIKIAMETTINSGEERWLDDCFTQTLLHPDASPRLPQPHNENEGIPAAITRDSTDEHKENRVASKPHSTPLTLKWLADNYELAEGVCIPRCTLYLHYLDFCSKNDSQPVNAASFGKIIRQQFLHLTTRRLGTRGQSKYHYYGIGVKESSPYYDLMFSKKGLNNCPADSRKEPIKQMVTYSPRSKLGTLLPEFPGVKDFKLPANVTLDKVTTFLMMYRTHCQRILDTVIRANFEEVQSFLLHFWQGMPQHIVPILGTSFIVNLVGVCDSILYQAIAGVLMPTVLQPLPDSLTQVIRKFGRQLDEWLQVALEGLPDSLTSMKFDLSRRFGQVLKRQTSLNHLCQASRTVIHSPDITTQMLDDWRHVDLNSICKQTLYTMDAYSERDHQTIMKLYKEFEKLLHEQAPLEAYTEWLDIMVNTCVVQTASHKPGSLRRIARQFLLMWSCFGTRVIRDMTLHSAPSFGSFHLLHLMFDDYVLFLVESLHTAERTNDLLRVIKGQESLADAKDEIVLPQPHLTGPFLQYSHSNQATVTMDTVSCNPADRQTVITDSRDVYNSNQYATSPLPPQSQSGESPSQSSMTSSYDQRGESELQMSPHNDNSMCSMGVNVNVDSDSRTSYNRYSNVPITTLPPSDLTANYQYSCNSTTQYSFTHRDYSHSNDWINKYPQVTQSQTLCHPSNIQSGNGYPYSRETDAYTTYDISGYTPNMRTQHNNNPYYSDYSADPRGYTENYTTNPPSRKRKGEDFIDRDYVIKRNVTSGVDYPYSGQTTAYMRS